MGDQGVDLFDKTSQLLLLRVQLILQPVKAQHHVVELLVHFLLSLTFAVAVQQAELVLEFLLDFGFRAIIFDPFLAVNGDEVSELGALLVVTDLDDDSHNDVLQRVHTAGLRVGEGDVFGHAHHVIARVLALLLEDLVLVNEHVTAEGIVFILLNELLHLLMGQDEELHVG